MSVDGLRGKSGLAPSGNAADGAESKTGSPARVLATRTGPTSTPAPAGSPSPLASAQAGGAVIIRAMPSPRQPPPLMYANQGAEGAAREKPQQLPTPKQHSPVKTMLLESLAVVPGVRRAFKNAGHKRAQQTQDHELDKHQDQRAESWAQTHAAQVADISAPVLGLQTEMQQHIKEMKNIQSELTQTWSALQAQSQQLAQSLTRVMTPQAAEQWMAPIYEQSSRVEQVIYNAGAGIDSFQENGLKSVEYTNNALNITRATLDQLSAMISSAKVAAGINA
jgi:hypothetical protein